MEEIIKKPYYFIYATNALTILGSILSLIIFSRPVFKRRTISFYCKCLAVFDMFSVFNLAFGITINIINVELIKNFDPICRFFYFISFSISPIPGWILVYLSVDQLFTVSMTKKFSFIKSRFFQYGVVLGTFLFHCGLYSMVIFQAAVANTTNENRTFVRECKNPTIIVPIIYVIESNILPFFIMIITTSFIIRITIKSKMKLKMVGNMVSSVSNRLGTINYFSSFFRKERERSMKFAFNSVFLNILHILFTTPICIYYVISQSPYYQDIFYKTYFLMFFYLNFALHFWIHLFVNSIFRHEFFVLFHIKKKTK